MANVYPSPWCRAPASTLCLAYAAAKVVSDRCCAQLAPKSRKQRIARRAAIWAADGCATSTKNKGIYNIRISGENNYYLQFCRLKNWIAAQAEREKETAARRQKKLERLCEQPRHEFKDEEYDKERSALPENVEDAVTQGFEAVAAASTSGSQKRRKANDIGSGVTAKKKRKLW